jgi:tRNA (guanosine-2'-O-)-methyltransferase
MLMFVRAERQARFAEVLARRTRRITVVLEDMYGAHNIAAVLRTCDAFGIQDVHVIEDNTEFQPEPEIALGSQKWLTLHQYREQPDPRRACCAALRDAGYRLLAVTPHAEAQPPEEVDVSRPCALLFGTEKEGLTEEITALADGAVRIPMCGFVESLNVSVAAAVCLYPMLQRLRSGPADWGLSAAERQALLVEWVHRSVPHRKALEAHFQQQFTWDQLEPVPPPAADDR